ncbi:phosphotransferase [Evansella sp. AB-rgal1]|uniref:phosphotransferase n=1 Tax=Evansella sp. AB-rgal1 TaxID=3242696 RepID=UPI00359E7917
MVMKLGKKIGDGGCSEVFELEKNKIIKLAKPNTSHSSMEREYQNSCLAWEAGLKVPKPYQIVEWNNRSGIIFEKVEGESLYTKFIKTFTKLVGELNLENTDQNSLSITAHVLSQIHATPISGLPSQRSILKYSILHGGNYLSSEEKQYVIDLLDKIPEKFQLCHGDPNPGNIIICDGKPVIIDWMEASIGNPEADIAEYILMLRYAVLPLDIPETAVRVFHSIREKLVISFMEEFKKRGNLPLTDMDSWMVVVAARKLSASGICEEEKQLLTKEIKKKILL